MLILREVVGKVSEWLQGEPYPGEVYKTLVSLLRGNNARLEELVGRAITGLRVGEGLEVDPKQAIEWFKTLVSKPGLRQSIDENKVRIRLEEYAAIDLDGSAICYATALCERSWPEERGEAPLLPYISRTLTLYGINMARA